MICFRDNIVFLIAKAHQHAQGLLKSRLKTFSITPVQCLVLECLWEEEGICVGDIGRRLILDTATLAGVLDRMVSAGWIRRKIDSADARIARIFLTKKAYRIVVELEETIEQTNRNLLKSFSMEEKMLYKRFLRDNIQKT